MPPLRFPVSIDVHENAIVISQNLERNQPATAVRLDAADLDAFCDLLYFARKEIEQRRNNEERRLEDQAMHLANEPQDKFQK